MNYYVDKAMLGSDFEGGDDDLITFCRCLKAYVRAFGITDVTIVPVTDTCNGAPTTEEQCEAEARIGAAWERALIVYDACRD